MLDQLNSKATLDNYLTPQKIKETELNSLKKSEEAFNEVLIDYSKYYERFMEGINLISINIHHLIMIHL